MHKEIEKAGRYLLRAIQLGWLRIKFVTGGWRGIMIHANDRGQLTKCSFIEGLEVYSDSPSLSIYYNDKEMMSVNRGAEEEVL